MSSHELTKKCPYNGCDYISNASSTHALENNVSTHVSNAHRGTTAVWFGGTKVTIHRDVKSNSFACPCGQFSHSNAECVRRHARNLHKKLTTARSATRAPKPAVTSEPKLDEAEIYRVVDPNPKDKLHIGGEVLVPTGPTVVHKAYPLVAMTPMGSPATKLSFYGRTSTFASSSSKASSLFFESIASTSASPAQPLPIPVSAAGPSTSRSVPSKRKVEESTPGPSKIRRVDATHPASVSKASASDSPSKAVSRTSVPKPLFTSAPLKLKSSAAISSGFASTSKKRPADEGLPEPSSSKVQRVSGWSTIAERKAAKLAKSPQSVAPVKAPNTLARKVTITKTCPTGDAPPTSTTPSAATAPTPAKGPPKPRPVVKPGSLVQTQAKPQASSPSKAEPKKHVRPAPAAGVAASSASSGFSTSTRGSPSSSSSSARTSATPAPDRAGPYSKLGPSGSRSRKCGDCGGPIDAYGENGMCTICYCESLPDAPLRCVTCGDKLLGAGKAKGSECTTCQLKALPPPHASSSTSVAKDTKAVKDAAPKTKTKTDAGAGQQQPKPRKKRVTRQMRQREFERWFARWTAVHRARRVTKPPREEGEEEGAGAGEREGEDGDKTDWWRVETTRNQGGVCYATPEAFFAALEGAFARQKAEGDGGEEGTAKEKQKGKDKEKGKGKPERGVLTFYGGYSIVAQPKISAIARLDRLVAKMEEIGFRLDSAQQGRVKFKYKSGGEVLDEVYKYPCSCGGAPPPVAEGEMRHAHRLPDQKHAGEVCGGTIMLMVGEDNALLAYGIQGQRIAVDIVH